MDVSEFLKFIEKVQTMPLLRVPLFPLPSAVLLPGAVLPLNIFEPRYKQMVEHAIAEPDAHKLVVMGNFTDTEAQTFSKSLPLCGLGRITETKGIHSDRSLILMQGVARVKIKKVIAPTDDSKNLKSKNPLYFTANLVIQSDTTSSEANLKSALNRLRASYLQISRHLATKSDPLLAAFEDIKNDSLLVDILSSSLIQNPENLQDILSTTCLTKRANLLMDKLSNILLRIAPLTGFGLN
jgi:Lon protease-like protein